MSAIVTFPVSKGWLDTFLSVSHVTRAIDGGGGGVDDGGVGLRHTNSAVGRGGR